MVTSRCSLLTLFVEDFTIFLLWSLIELNVAMICACLPTLRPMASKFPHSLKSVKTLKSLLSLDRFRSYSSQKHLDSNSRGSSRVNIKYADPFFRSELLGIPTIMQRHPLIPKSSNESHGQYETGFYGSSMQTTISTIPPHKNDLEFQSQQRSGIHIQNAIQYKNSTIA